LVAGSRLTVVPLKVATLGLVSLSLAKLSHIARAATAPWMLGTIYEALESLRRKPTQESR
jgi:hypothetical protein